MRMKWIVITLMFALFLQYNLAECSQVKVMYAPDLVSEGEDTKVFPLKDYYKEVIDPLRKDFDRIKEKFAQVKGSDSYKLLIESEIKLQQSSYHNQFEKGKNLTLKDMIKNGWKIAHVEKLQGGILSLSILFAEYTNKDKTEFLFFLEK